MVVVFKETDEEFHLIEYITAVTWLFSFSIVGKIIFAFKTNSRFIFTIANFIDIAIMIMVAIIWIIATIYETREIPEPLFNEEEDKEIHVKFVANIMADIESETFHFNYLLAAVTAALWLRCIILLRLTESFGPLLVMIAKMAQIMVKFFFLYGVGILTLASVATLTLTADDDFKDLFSATRTYFEGSLGSFNLRQYDELPGWQRYYGFGLHSAVLFLNMLIMVNLLVAIMSDEYVRLSEVRIGLYWT